MAVERNLPPVYAAMESRGIKIDTEVLHKLENDSPPRPTRSRKIYQLLKAFHSLFPQQLGEVSVRAAETARRHAHEIRTRATDAGHPRKTGHGDRPPRPQENPRMAHADQTDLDLHEGPARGGPHARTGRPHLLFAAATSTGRMASNDPNLQNIPIRTEEGRKIRTLLVRRQIQFAHLRRVQHKSIALDRRNRRREGLKEAFASARTFTPSRRARYSAWLTIRNWPGDTRRRPRPQFRAYLRHPLSAWRARRHRRSAKARDFIGAYFLRYPEIKTYMDEIKKERRRTKAMSKPSSAEDASSTASRKKTGAKGGSRTPGDQRADPGAAADLIKMAMIAIHKADPAGPKCCCRFITNDSGSLREKSGNSRRASQRHHGTT